MLFLAMCVTAQVKYGETVRGVASYYADSFQGHKMANGQKYDKDSFTCAHLKYPFGTLVRVKNLANGKECVVKVTDRGPYTRKYIIDLSKAAAKHLDYLHGGHTKVEITPLANDDKRWKPGILEDTDSLGVKLEYTPAESFQFRGDSISSH